jgi:hypothetical protein
MEKKTTKKGGNERIPQHNTGPPARSPAGHQTGQVHGSVMDRTSNRTGKWVSHGQDIKTGQVNGSVMDRTSNRTGTWVSHGQDIKQDR